MGWTRQNGLYPVYPKQLRKLLVDSTDPVSRFKVYGCTTTRCNSSCWIHGCIPAAQLSVIARLAHWRPWWWNAGVGMWIYQKTFASGATTLSKRTRIRRCYLFYHGWWVQASSNARHWIVQWLATRTTSWIKYMVYLLCLFDTLRSCPTPVMWLLKSNNWWRAWTCSSGWVVIQRLMFTMCAASTIGRAGQPAFNYY